MGFFKIPKQQTITPQTDTSESSKEAKETTAKKARLLETQGANKGSELQTNQGKSVRKIFGS